MDSGKQEALEALETAIQMEVEGHEFYVKAAARVSWPEGTETLLDLAKDEMEHIWLVEEEKGHQATLTDYAKYIGAQNEWLLEHERPILEG